MAVRVKITQIKSAIDRNKKQKETLKALGLRKMNASVEHSLNPNIQGMINKVAHLVSVEEAIGVQQSAVKAEKKGIVPVVTAEEEE